MRGLIYCPHCGLCCPSKKAYSEHIKEFEKSIREEIEKIKQGGVKK